MPFGVNNVPTQFMRMMNDLLAEYLDIFVLILLDNTLVYSQFVEEHAEHIRKVFQKLRDYRLYTKVSNREISKTALEFLGCELAVDGMA